MSETLVKVENVSKKFCRDLKKSLWYGVKDVFGEVTGQCKSSDALRPEEFWSVSDVSFELKRGECLGLIGPNGAGKSTLLKMLTGLIKPDRGRISMRGRIGALIELGAGFNPILTGRENIYVNGAVLGFTREEIDRKYNAIVDFAEMSEFIETPVQNYSSGMKVRLGFAVAAHMDPDVLLIDEVLAVGDVGFKAKCFNAINNLIQKTAVIFVSHSMPQVSRICSDISVMQNGKTVYLGKDIGCGIGHYYTLFKSEKERQFDTGRAVLHSFQLESRGRHDVDVVEYLEDLKIHIGVTVEKSIRHPTFSIVIVNQELQYVAQCNSYMNEFKYENTGDRKNLSLTLSKLNLNPGLYSFDVAITAEKSKEVLTKHSNIKHFRVEGKHVGYAPVQLFGKWEEIPQNLKKKFSNNHSKT